MRVDARTLFGLAELLFPEEVDTQNSAARIDIPGDTREHDHEGEHLLHHG